MSGWWDRERRMAARTRAQRKPREAQTYANMRFTTGLKLFATFRRRYALTPPTRTSMTGLDFRRSACAGDCGERRLGVSRSKRPFRARRARALSTRAGGDTGGAGNFAASPLHFTSAHAGFLDAELGYRCVAPGRRTNGMPI